MLRDDELAALGELLPANGEGGELTEFALEDLAENVFGDLAAQDEQDDLAAALSLPQALGVDYAALELYVVRHSVHNTVTTGTNREYVVSNMRDFQVDVELHDRRSGQLSSEPLELRAVLLYENGQPVRQSSAGEVVLSGARGVDAPVATLSGGRATFLLRMGLQTLTKKHDGQRFRIRIEPTEAALSGTVYPCLTQLTEPLKSVTKLFRTPANAAAAASLAAKPAGAAATVAPRSDCSLSRQHLGGSVGGPSSSLPLPTGHNAHSSAGSSAGASSAACAVAAPPPLAAAERQSIEKYVKDQKAQIDQLVTLNKYMKQELERLKAAEQERKKREEQEGA
jgi:hypothetical protein